MVIPTAAIATCTVRSGEERQRQEEEKSKRREIRPKRRPVEKAWGSLRVYPEFKRAASYNK
jgi:hypothetical protein